MGVPQITPEGSRDQNLRGGGTQCPPPCKVGLRKVVRYSSQNLVISSKPVDSSSQQVTAHPHTPALSMRVAVPGGRGVLQDVSPFTTRT